MTRAFKPFKLPSVTAYLIAGVLIGPYVLGSLNIPSLGFSSMEAVGSLAVISEIALGFIAFSIGSEFKLEELKHIGKQAFVIGIFQAIVATIFVDAALLVVHLIMPDKLTLYEWYQKTGNVFEFYDADNKICPFYLKRKGEQPPKPDYREHIHAITDYNWSACFTELLILNRF